MPGHWPDARHQAARKRHRDPRQSARGVRDDRERSDARQVTGRLMSAPTGNSLAPHVEAAKRVLRELERHADAAIDTLNGGDSNQFAAAIQERETLLAKLSQVVDVLS